MATPAQIAANRANAQQSTGPRSAEGKAASRFNALKHGIDAHSIVLPGEDPDAYDALARSYYDSILPRTPEETFHVDTMIRADWQKRRLEIVEADLYRALMAEFPNVSLATALLSDSPTVRVLLRIQKQLAAFDRAWSRAHTTLHRNRAKTEAIDADLFALGLSTAPLAPSMPPSDPAPRLASFPLPNGPAIPTPASNRPETKLAQ